MSENSPYLGLRPYQESEKDKFFGRQHEIHILTDKILAHRLTLLVAASGVGKSSLLQAGVMPALRASGMADLIYHNDWALNPLLDLKKTIVKHFIKLQRVNADYQADFSLPLVDFLQIHALLGSGTVVILLDQFEEFFYYQRFSQQRDEFIRQLATAIHDTDTPTAFVFSMREDFAMEMEAFKPWYAGIFNTIYRIEKLELDAARQAIVEPVKAVGFTYQADLIELLLKDLGERERNDRLDLEHIDKPQPNQLLVEPPHLQIVCQQLWLNACNSPEQLITLEHYQNLGKAEGILASYFNDKMAKLSEEQQRLASKAFTLLVSPHGAKISYPLKELADSLVENMEDLQSCLEQLQQASILRRLKRNGKLWYELYHDIFARSIIEWGQWYTRQQLEKFNESFIEKMANLSNSQLRLASKAFDFLAWPGASFSVDDLTNLIWEDIANLQQTLDLLQNLTILRTQQYQGKIRYSLYHHFFVENIRQWNNAYKRKQFKKKLVISGGFMVLSGLSMFLAYDIWENYKAVQNRLGNETISERVEFYQGDLRSWDIFRQQHFIYESDFERKDIEADKRFESEQIAELKSSQIVQIGKLPLVNRFAGYATVGLFDNADKIFKSIQKSDNNDLIAELIPSISNVRVQKTIERLFLFKDNIDNNNYVAIESLQQINTVSAKNKLLKLLKDSDTGIRSAAINALAQSKEKEVIQQIIPLLKDNDSNVRSASIYALAQSKEKAVLQQIIALLKDNDWQVRQAAQNALAQSKDKAVLQQIIPLLKDNDIRVRSATINALAQSKEKEVIQQIIPLLKDNDSNVRSAAIEALAQSKEKEVIQQIIPLLKDNDSRVRSATINALAQSKEKEVIQQIIPFLKDNDRYVRSVANYALENFKIEMLVFKNNKEQLIYWQQEQINNLSVSLLIPMLKNADSDVITKAITSLSKIGEIHPEWLVPYSQHIIEAAEKVKVDLDDNIAIKIQAELIATAKNETQKNPIFSLIQDPNQPNYLRFAALEGLENTNRPDIGDFLLKLLQDPKQDAIEMPVSHLLAKMAYSDAKEMMQQNLDKAVEEKKQWRAKRDAYKYKPSTNDEDVITRDPNAPKAWLEDYKIYQYAYAIARIDPQNAGIELLNHPLYQAREAAIRALAEKANGALIKKLLEYHQNFNPQDLPSPLPYSTYKALDKALEQVEYTGTAEDLAILKQLKGKKISTQMKEQERAINERFDWTIAELSYRLKQNLHTVH